MICDSTSSNWNYYNSHSYDNWWINLLFTGFAPLFLGAIISLDSDGSSYALGFIITIGDLTLVGLRIVSHCFMGLLREKDQLVQ
ncbi:MAG TPA: hypothetical protein VJU85_01670 [Nitrososphaeraceae archaeon]|nr:hypothetical protein [Nitrososphaeraceae archaeon]